MINKSKPKRGRPPLAPEDKTNSARFSLVLQEELAQKISTAAEGSGTSRNALIVELLEDGFETTVGTRADFGSANTKAICTMLGRLISNYETGEDGNLWDDQGAFDEMKEAVGTVLDCFGPNPGIAPLPDKSSAGRRARSLLSGYHKLKKDMDGKRPADLDTLLRVDALKCLDQKLLDRLEPKG
jgi:hypothetical protein